MGLHKLADLLTNQGELLEGDFDQLGIRNNIQYKGLRKGGIIVSKKRFVFLIYYEFIKKQRIKTAAKDAQKAFKSRKRKLGANTTESSANIIALMDNLPISPYVCASGKCIVFSCEGDDDKGWLQCECCIPAIWTCGLCSGFMKHHEKRAKVRKY